MDDVFGAIIDGYDKWKEEEAVRGKAENEEKQREASARTTAFQLFVNDHVKRVFNEADDSLRERGRHAKSELFPDSRPEARFTFNVKKDQRVGVKPKEDSVFVVKLLPYGPAICESYFDRRYRVENPNAPQKTWEIGSENFNIAHVRNALADCLKDAFHRHSF